mmetsp:Transcript_19783/g.40350  ORF Transcript_19783/g.40350 Transcript_19783/m.40350 type:complete len:235 (+) Transcript_19783:518-1222(+)
MFWVMGTILPMGSTISFLMPVMMRSWRIWSRPGTCIISRPIGMMERSRFGCSVIEIQITRTKGAFSWRWMRKMSSVSMLMFSTRMGIDTPPLSTTSSSTPALSSETNRMVAVTHISLGERISLMRPRMTHGDDFFRSTLVALTSFTGPAGSTLSRRSPCKIASSKMCSLMISPILVGYRSQRFLTTPLSHSVVSVLFKSGAPPFGSFNLGGGAPALEFVGFLKEAIAKNPTKLP